MVSSVFIASRPRRVLSLASPYDRTLLACYSFEREILSVTVGHGHRPVFSRPSPRACLHCVVHCNRPPTGGLCQFEARSRSESHSPLFLPSRSAFVANLGSCRPRLGTGSGLTVVRPEISATAFSLVHKACMEDLTILLCVHPLKLD